MLDKGQTLYEQAAACGVARSYLDAWGREIFASDSALKAVIQSISGKPISARQFSTHTVEPLTACYQPAARERFGGVSLQLYALRSEADWGIGDFGVLRELIPVLAEKGFDFVGLSPLHATTHRSGTNFSPYSPSSRIFYSPIYIDVSAAAELCGVRVERPVSEYFVADLIEYGEVWRIKLAVLDAIFKEFKSKGPQRTQRRFGDYLAIRESVQLQTALFFAIQEELQSNDSAVWGWPVWPKEFQDVHSEAVAKQRVKLAAQMEYQLFLQWLCEEQLAAVVDRAKAAGMKLGLYTDLALGSGWGGADSWIWRDCFCGDISCGAPPDELGPLGQDWGFAPFHPGELERTGAEPFRLMLRSAMKYAAAVRLDHVMSLCRLFWIPRGMKAVDGVYVSYPTSMLFDIVAEESRKANCLVIGEDLVTVPDEIRQQLDQCGVYSYKVVFFMRDGGGYFLPKDYPRRALAVISTHDLPTLSGFFSSSDLRLRNGCGLFTDASHYEALQAKRRDDSDKLIEVLRFLKLDPDRDLKAALFRFLELVDSQLFCVQLEDVFGMADQMNLPGTLYEYPNWKRRYPAKNTKQHIQSTL